MVIVCAILGPALYKPIATNVMSFNVSTRTINYLVEQNIMPFILVSVFVFPRTAFPFR